MIVNRLSYVSAEWLGIKKEDVKIINSTDVYNDDNEWGVVFLHPPKSVEYYTLKSSSFGNAGEEPTCLSQEKAFFGLSEKLTNHPYLVLTE